MRHYINFSTPEPWAAYEVILTPHMTDEEYEEEVRYLLDRMYVNREPEKNFALARQIMDELRRQSLTDDLYFMSALIPGTRAELYRRPVITVTDNIKTHMKIIQARIEAGYKQETKSFRSLKEAEEYIARTYGPTNYWRTEEGVHEYYGRRPR